MICLQETPGVSLRGFSLVYTEIGYSDNLAGSGRDPNVPLCEGRRGAESLLQRSSPKGELHVRLAEWTQRAEVEGANCRLPRRAT